MPEKKRINLKDIMMWLVLAGIIILYFLLRILYRDEIHDYMVFAFNELPVLLPAIGLFVFSKSLVDELNKQKRGENNFLSQLVSIVSVILFFILLIMGLINAF